MAPEQGGGHTNTPSERAIKTAIVHIVITARWTVCLEQRKFNVVLLNLGEGCLSAFEKSAANIGSLRCYDARKAVENTFGICAFDFSGEPGR